MRILVVEGDQETAVALKANLEAEYYSVDVAHDGERGSYLARTNGYDLILLANILPRKCGAEVCRELRARGITVPVLVLSVRAEVAEKVCLLDCGADDYMTKPYLFSEVSARVRALLRRPHRVETPQLALGDLVLDRARFAVARGKKRIDLTPKEFSLLEYLMKNEGCVVSRAMLLEHVWDGEIDPFSNTIEAHMYNLRRKVDGTGKDKLIHTVPGRGYRITDASSARVHVNAEREKDLLRPR